jgi:hypothetical protein
MFWTGRMPRSTRTPETLMTYRDSRSTSAARSPLIQSARVRALSSSVDRSYPLGGCRPRSSSSTSIASCTSRSVSYRQRRI